MYLHYQLCRLDVCIYTINYVDEFTNDIDELKTLHDILTVKFGFFTIATCLNICSLPMKFLLLVQLTKENQIITYTIYRTCMAYKEVKIRKLVNVNGYALCMYVGLVSLVMTLIIRTM